MFEILMLIGFFSAVLSTLISHSPKQDPFAQRPVRPKKQKARSRKKAKTSNPPNAETIFRPRLKKVAY
ncbi:hypothetical protein [Desulfuromonas sp. AOP6]|uniref:hypothetical protein n=1 Tax=Desulfuromonas sp. AOP6 TaxID=1566351 RepID=UPI00127390D8|nr:hypothetical protein [Desulfuromonas sp. AOP6]BCA80254.1 hypothetical protein AOP6_2041 [Desulfuromonas sp. AOP6]